MKINGRTLTFLTITGTAVFHTSVVHVLGHVTVTQRFCCDFFGFHVLIVGIAMMVTRCCNR